MSEDTQTNSIIDPKYAKKYRGETDFIGDLITEQCQVEETTETKSGKEKTTRRLDVDRMLELAVRNGANVDKLQAGKDSPNAPGRIRMSVGNMLRARAIKRHGLYNLQGEVVNAPREFLQHNEAPSQPTETIDGEKIKTEKEAA
jgi:hypothetical protein